MLSVTFFYCNAECHKAECHYAECRYAEFHYAECHYAEYHYAECHYAECHCIELLLLLLSGIIGRQLSINWGSREHYLSQNFTIKKLKVAFRIPLPKFTHR
jgi:hypothetical protein